MSVRRFSTEDVFQLVEGAERIARVMKRPIALVLADTFGIELDANDPDELDTESAGAVVPERRQRTAAAAAVPAE